MNYKQFFDKNADEVATNLLGKYLIKKDGKKLLSARIIEVGAYEGGKEVLSREGMKYEAGSIFLMSHRGAYLFNITTKKKYGVPSCVEVRKIRLENKTINGSGKVTKALHVDKGLDGILFEDEFKLIGETADEFKKQKGISDNCNGIYRIK